VRLEVKERLWKKALKNNNGISTSEVEITSRHFHLRRHFHLGGGNALRWKCLDKPA